MSFSKSKTFLVTTDIIDKNGDNVTFLTNGRTIKEASYIACDVKYNGEAIEDHITSIVDFDRDIVTGYFVDTLEDFNPDYKESDDEDSID